MPSPGDGARSLIQGTEMPFDDDFERSVKHICDRVVTAIQQSGAIHTLFVDDADAVFIKSVEGKILLTNKSYDALFTDGVSPVGRLGVSYLDDTIAPISSHSDAMILDGCRTIHFDHVGHDNQGREVRMRTVKKSLLGLGHPTIAILGIVRVVEVLNYVGKPARSLRVMWASFNQLDELDRNIAIGLARGKNVAMIAAENSVTKKTIENHRSNILRTLGYDSPISVIKLMVRLQENGYGDFGV